MKLILFLHDILSVRIIFLAVHIIIHILNTVKPPLIFIAMWSRFTGLINFISFALVSACSLELTIHIVWPVKRHRRCRIDGSGNAAVKYHYSYCVFSLIRLLGGGLHGPLSSLFCFFQEEADLACARMRRKLENWSF